MTKTTLHLEGGRTFTVVANDLSAKSKYVKSVTLNGKPLDGFVIRHEGIMRGGELAPKAAERLTNRGRMC